MCKFILFLQSNCSFAVFYIKVFLKIIETIVVPTNSGHTNTYKNVRPHFGQS